MATPNYDINYDDKRFTEVESDKKQALSDLEKTYAGMINNSDKYYQAQIDASKQWADKQTQLQNEQTDFAIEQIEQQKAQTKKDYIKEQSGAYVDWQKQSNQYGANAEEIAAGGMTNTGFAESSQVSMYNTYQNRVATARESYNLAVLNYNNSIKEAQLQNNSVLAEIAYEALQKQLELSLQGFQYKNQLILDKANKKTELDNVYYARYQDVLDQINTENALAEEVRQYNATLAQQQAALEEEKRQHNETLALQKAQLDEEKRQFNATLAAKSSSSSSKSSSSGSKISKSSGKSGSGSSGVKSISSKTASVANSAKKKTETSQKDTMSSILALGYGPISASKLNSLVQSGVVEEYTSNGKTLFRNSASTIKQKMLFNKLR